MVPHIITPAVGENPNVGSSNALLSLMYRQFLLETNDDVEKLAAS